MLPLCVRMHTKNIRHYIVKLLAPSIFDFAVKAESRCFSENLKGDDLVGVEIGVDQGENAVNLLKNANINQLFLVDPYQPTAHKHNYNREIDYIKAVENLKPFLSKCTFIKKFSHEAKKRFSLNSLDFVYIDGDHSFNGCFNDITDYYPLIKKEGIIGGHDFSNSYIGVIKAVVLFCNTQKIEFKVKGREWWFTK